MAPRARTPSFSSQRIAVAYSISAKEARTNTSPIKAKMARTNTSPIKVKMAVVNWENVLVPMDWMMVYLGLGRSTDSIQQAVARYQHSPELLRGIAAIEGRIMELLTETVQSISGPVFITSDYPTVFIEHVSSLFFPRLTAALRNATTGIYVVGAPDTKLTTVELTNWKANLLHTVIFENLFAGMGVNETQRLLNKSAPGQIGIVALCARESDVTATTAIYSIAPNAIIKRVKVKAGKAPCATHPLGSPIPLEDFHAQLQALTQFVQQTATSINCISINL